MLNDTEKAALRTWYSQDQFIDPLKKFIEEGAWERIEEHVHRTCLLPLGRHEQLPDYMRDEEGGPLFPTNFDPRNDETGWQAAIEVGWEVVLTKTGTSHNDVHRRIAGNQEDDWKTFLESVEQRKKDRGLS